MDTLTFYVEQKSAGQLTNIIFEKHDGSGLGQIGHRELVGAIGRTCAVSGPQRAPAAQKCTVRALLAPSARTTLLGRPFGRVEGAKRCRIIRHRQDDLLGAAQR